MHPGPIALTPSTAQYPPIWSEVDDARLDASEDDEVHGFDDGKLSFRARVLELYQSWVSQITYERAWMTNGHVGT